MKLKIMPVVTQGEESTQSTPEQIPWRHLDNARVVSNSNTSVRISWQCMQEVRLLQSRH